MQSIFKRLHLEHSESGTRTHRFLAFRQLEKVLVESTQWGKALHTWYKLPVDDAW